MRFSINGTLRVGQDLLDVLQLLNIICHNFQEIGNSLMLLCQNRTDLIRNWFRNSILGIASREALDTGEKFIQLSAFEIFHLGLNLFQRRLQGMAIFGLFE